jgi:CCR4-NOT transcription complex subunit 3
MSNRKLLGEIDRVLKKVDEGVAIFEQIWDKVYSASTTAQKEKYEADLKKEIKKLQRLRDQIKTWQGDSSVKDKTKLDQNRKLIEEKMEKFKVCEKETKTKAFSKEGLAQDRTDPKQKAKAEVGDWVRESISKLREQSDEFEAEIEQLSTGGKRKKRGEEPPRVAELKECILRHEHHVEMLERVLRAIDNEQVTPKQCNDELRDNVEFYIEESQEGGDYDDEGMYDSLNLDAPSTAPLPVASSVVLKKDKKDGEGPTAKSPPQATSPSAAGAALSAAANAAAAAAAVAANANAPASAGGDIVSPKGRTGRGMGIAANSATSPQGRMNGANGRDSHGGGINSAVSPSRRGGADRDSAVSPSLAVVRAPQAQSLPSASGRGPSLGTVVNSQAQSLQRQQEQEAAQLHIAGKQSRSQDGGIPHAQQRLDYIPQQIHVSPQVRQQERRDHNTKDASRSGTLLPGDAGWRSDAGREPSPRTEVDANGSSTAGVPSDLAALDVASTMMPELPAEDAGGDETLFPTVPSFPTVVAGVFDEPALFKKFDPDTLFFIFYYRQGTYHQYLASRELKRQGWRYHTKYKVCAVALVSDFAGVRREWRPVLTP